MATERKGRGRPRDPQADRAILMQTLRLLAEQGYAAMSVESVAAAAGVGKATLYRRYRDKRDLVVAVKGQGIILQFALFAVPPRR